MAETADNTVAVIGIDTWKNSFHVVGPDRRGSIVPINVLKRILDCNRGDFTCLRLTR